MTKFLKIQDEYSFVGANDPYERIAYINIASIEQLEARIYSSGNARVFIYFKSDDAGKRSAREIRFKTLEEMEGFLASLEGKIEIATSFKDSATKGSFKKVGL